MNIGFLDAEKILKQKKWKEQQKPEIQKQLRKQKKKKREKKKTLEAAKQAAAAVLNYSVSETEENSPKKSSEIHSPRQARVVGASRRSLDDELNQMTNKDTEKLSELRKVQPKPHQLKIKIRHSIWICM